eukprot:694750-Pleurochrysis_carterae.AAC.4
MAPTGTLPPYSHPRMNICLVYIGAHICAYSENAHKSEEIGGSGWARTSKLWEGSSFRSFPETGT